MEILALAKILIEVCVKGGFDVVEIIKNAEISPETKEALLKRIDEAQTSLRKPEEV